MKDFLYQYQKKKFPIEIKLNQDRFLLPLYVSFLLKPSPNYGQNLIKTSHCVFRNGRTDYTMYFAWYNLSDHFLKGSDRLRSSQKNTLFFFTHPLIVQGGSPP